MNGSGLHSWRTTVRAVGALVLLSAAQPASAVTGVYLDSEPGEYVGQGQEYTFDGSQLVVSRYTDVVIARFDGWYAYLEARDGTLVTAGDYEGARYIGSTHRPGLRVFYPGRSCQITDGWFRIHELQASGDTVTVLAADFAHICGGKVLYGSIRLNSSFPLMRTEPYARALSPLHAVEGSTVTLDGSKSFAPGNTISGYQWEQTSGLPVTLAGADGPVATFTAPSLLLGVTLPLAFRLTVTAANGQADFIDVTVHDYDAAAARSGALLDSTEGDYVAEGVDYAYDENTATIKAGIFNSELRLSIDGDEEWDLRLYPRADETLQPGMYAGAIDPFRQARLQGGLDFTMSNNCSDHVGWFEIVELEVVGNQVQKLAVDLAQRCAIALFGTRPPAFVAIRINSAVPVDRDTVYAAAGVDVATIEGHPVVLDGTESFTRESSPLQYQWQQLSGPVAQILDPSAALTGIDPPAGGADMVFQLTVSDGTGRTDTDTVRVLVRGEHELQTSLFVDGHGWVGQNRDWLFTADNSIFRLQLIGNAFGIDIEPGDAHWSLGFSPGLGAQLAPGAYEDAQRYSFEEPGHPGVEYSGDGHGCNGATGRFDVLSITFGSGTIESAAIDFEHSCEGDPAATSYGQFRYNVIPADLPKARAGADKSTVENTVTSLDGSASSAPGFIATYQWSQLSGPAVTLVGAGTATPQFTAPLGVTELRFRLAVTDDAGNYGADTITVTTVLDLTDDDGDGVRNYDDVFPLDPDESVDTDGDGTGNNADTDDDADGHDDSADAFPTDPAEFEDTDADGIGNNGDIDDDNDGPADFVEEYFPGGDGNGDGLPDSRQAGVLTMVDHTGAMLTVEAGPGVTITRAYPNGNLNAEASPNRVRFRRDFLELELDVAVGGGGTVTLRFHGADRPDTYWKYDPFLFRFYEFLYNGTTGAQVLSDRIVLHFVDGGRGDSDGAANGHIVDPGAPGWKTGGGGPMAPAGLALLLLAALRRRSARV